MPQDEPSDWFVDVSRIRLRLPSGEIVDPSATEVASAEFKDRLEIRGQAIGRRPSDALPGLKFTRFPPSLMIRVTPPSSDLASPPYWTLWLEDGGWSSPVESRQIDNQDQIVLGDNWYPLAPDEVSEVGDLLSQAGVVQAGELSLRQYIALLQSDSPYITITEPTAPSAVPPREPGFALPSNFQATLYPYQRDGFRWLSRIANEEFGCILADEMGLGKTIQVIALLARESSEGRSPSLIVAPATLLENWRREIARFAPDLRTCVHRGPERTGFPSSLQPFDVVITSYDAAVRDSSILEMVRWNVVALDEAQNIKNPGTQRTVSVKELPRRIAVAISGTPVENRLTDLWSLMDFSVPGFLGNLAEFERRYSDSESGAGSLEPLVSPLILRRRIVDVATDLPERIDIPQPIELSASAAQAYDELREEIAQEYGAAATLVSIGRLRMFCTHPSLVNDSGSDLIAASTKYERLLELLEEILASGEKAIIFTSFTGMIDILLSDLSSRYGIPCFMIDGRTAVDRRQPTVDEFSETSGGAALILNPKAAGTGLNITAANHVIHYNLEWNPAVEDQATARAHRRGQVCPVTVHRLFYVGTVEEVINERMQRKRALADQAIVGTAGKGDDLADIMRALSLSPITGNGPGNHA